MSDLGEGMIWVRSEPSPFGGGYFATLQLGPDRIAQLNPIEAKKHALAVLSAVHRCEYDAAVMRQLTSLKGLEESAAGMLIEGLRNERPTLPSTKGLSMAPSVARDQTPEGVSYRPFIALYLDGEPFGQWDTTQARRHALAVLETPLAADLDSAYAKVLVSLIQVDSVTAAQIVGDLAKHREPGSVDLEQDEPAHGDRAECGECGQSIEYIAYEVGTADGTETLDAWWSHGEHPEDGHEAVPAGA